uniref:EGF-like domain-containing protein n=1 Tax=Anser cygnoides TaxID=8845 RepID=A0A8B9DHI4_ANSCY
MLLTLLDIIDLYTPTSDYDCIGNQCSEYGFCQDHLHNYSCNCMPGYEGPFCEVEINECSSSPCKNGATCVNLIDHFSYCLVSFAGFSGQYCEIEMNECDSSPCLNGAVCQNDVNRYDCFCPEGKFTASIIS